MRDLTAPFPTDVGMNRHFDWVDSRNCTVPHRRGDEPQSGGNPQAIADPFPTDVGMNRSTGLIAAG